MMSLDRLKILIGKIETDYCDETAFELSEAVDRLEYELEANAKLRERVAELENVLVFTRSRLMYHGHSTKEIDSVLSKLAEESK